MQTITNQVSLSLILLWSHVRGELCNKTIDAAADKPMYSLVKADGSAIDKATAATAYGVHTGSGVVYWANAVFNSDYIVWPDATTDLQKTAITAQLEKSFLIIR